MKPLAELDHYELLEVAREATPQEIERAYRVVRDAYESGSLGTYSIFTPDDAATLRERLEVAYRVLADPEARRQYDATRDTEPSQAPPPPGDASDAPRLGAAEAPPPQPEPARPPQNPRFELFDENEDGRSGAAWDGARLRRSRLLRGVELDQIARITKINPTYLRFLEEERFADLPASVYVRGFVTAYARTLGLDPASIASSYMRRFETRRQTPRLRPSVDG